jgi:hypothetical protein
MQVGLRRKSVHHLGIQWIARTMHPLMPAVLTYEKKPTTTYSDWPVSLKLHPDYKYGRYTSYESSLLILKISPSYLKKIRLAKIAYTVNLSGLYESPKKL